MKDEDYKMAKKERQGKLRELRKKIKAEVRFVDIKPYSHNIISLCLMQIAQEFGKEFADSAIEDFGLEKLGWRKGG